LWLTSGTNWTLKKYSRWILTSKFDFDPPKIEISTLSPKILCRIKANIVKSSIEIFLGKLSRDWNTNWDCDPSKNWFIARLRRVPFTKKWDFCLLRPRNSKINDQNFSFTNNYKAHNWSNKTRYRTIPCDFSSQRRSELNLTVEPKPKP
jgi:hypothetical protein